MSLKSRLTIVRPCPIVEQVRAEAGSESTMDCRLCQKPVQNLIFSDEATARRRLDAVQGQDICVIYRMGPDGEPIFADKPCGGQLSFGPQFRAFGVAAFGTMLVLGLQQIIASEVVVGEIPRESQDVCLGKVIDGTCEMPVPQDHSARIDDVEEAPHLAGMIMPVEQADPITPAEEDALAAKMGPDYKVEPKAPPQPNKSDIAFRQRAFVAGGIHPGR